MEKLTLLGCKFSYLLLFTGFILGSCQTIYYVPNTQNVPMIREKGELDLNVKGVGTQIELQGAYGVGESVAIQVNGMVLSPDWYWHHESVSGYLYEGGVGYYRNVAPRFLFDTYLLCGVGRVDDFWVVEKSLFTNYTNYRSSARYMRYTLQPSFSYISDYFSASASLRAGVINYTGLESVSNGIAVPNSDVKLRSPYFVVSPSLTLRAGFKRFKFQMQYLYSSNLTDPYFPQRHGMLTVGFNFHY